MNQHLSVTNRVVAYICVVFFLYWHFPRFLGGSYVKALMDVYKNSCSCFCILLVQLLLDAGADADIKSDTHETPSMVSSDEACRKLLHDWDRAITVALSEKRKEAIQRFEHTQPTSTI